MVKPQSEEKYLKPKQYYIDLYDLSTIEECLRWNWKLGKVLLKAMEDPKLKDIPKKKRKTDFLRMMSIVIHAIKLTRFKNKASEVRDWMSRDERKQVYYDSAQPEDVYCPKCNILMENFSKILRDYPEGTLKVLFFYKCSRCNNRRGLYDNGEEYVSPSNLCPECNSELSSATTRQGSVVTTTEKCSSCNYKDTDVLDLNDDTWEKQQKENKEKLEKYRSEFCFTEEEGNKALVHMDSIKRFVDDMKKKEKKEKDPVYQKAKQLKKLKVVEVHKVLKSVMEKSGYTNLEFEKPEMGRYVVVPFVAQESDAKKHEYNSRKQLKKLITSTLKNTNWRLMSEGVDYRIGYLSGRLKCFENEDDLVKLVAKG